MFVLQVVLHHDAQAADHELNVMGSLSQTVWFVWFWFRFCFCLFCLFCFVLFCFVAMAKLIQDLVRSHDAGHETGRLPTAQNLGLGYNPDWILFKTL